MLDFLSFVGCALAFFACFAVLKKTRCKKTFQLYPSGGKLKMEQGKFYDVCFGYSCCHKSMQFTGASFRVDKDGIDATVKFDSRPKQFITFTEGK